MNLSCLFSGPANWNNFKHRFLLIYVQNGNIYVKEILLALGKKPEKDLSAETLTSEIQTDQSSNIMIKCLFIFFKYQIFFYTSILLINSPPILTKKKNQKKNQVCITLGRTTSRSLMTQPLLPSATCEDNRSMFSPEE